MKSSSIGSLLLASALAAGPVAARADDSGDAGQAVTADPAPALTADPAPAAAGGDQAPAAPSDAAPQPAPSAAPAAPGTDAPQALDPTLTPGAERGNAFTVDAAPGTTPSGGDPVPDVQATDPSIIGPSALEVQAVPNFFIEDFDIPPFLLPIYQAAGSEYGIRWEVLASINRVETAFGTNLNVSSAGALGWMQFMPATWETYGVDANGDGEKDPFNPADAIFAAARYLKAAGGDTDLRKAIFAYNHADWYVNQVMDGASQIASIPEPIISSLAALTQGLFPIDAADRSITYRGKLKTTGEKDKVAPGDDASDTVEGDASTNSIDVDAPAGSRVVAVQDGVIEKVGKSDRLGTYVRLRDAYGNRYTYAHLGEVQDKVPVPKPVKDSGSHKHTDDGPAAKPDADPSPDATATTPDAAATTPATPGASSDDAAQATPKATVKPTPKPTAKATPEATTRVTPKPTATPGDPRPTAPATAGTTPASSTPTTPAASTRAVAPTPAAETPMPLPTGPRRHVEAVAQLASDAPAQATPEYARRYLGPDGRASDGETEATVQPGAATTTSAPTGPLSEYFSIDYGLTADDVRLLPLIEGRHVIAGTVLGRLASSADASLTFEIQPAGLSAPRIDPKPILDGWRLMDRTAFYRAQVKQAIADGGATDDASAGQVLLMSKAELSQRVLNDERISIYECGRRDIKAGIVDRRILALLEYLANKGASPSVSSLQCGHGLMTASGNVSEHSTGTAVDISTVYGKVITPGTQGEGSITDRAVREILKLQGAMKPHQIITLMQYAGTDNTFAMGDHDDHIHVGYRPITGNGGKRLEQLLKPGQWNNLLKRLGSLKVPTVSAAPSEYSVTVRDATK